MKYKHIFACLLAVLLSGGIVLHGLPEQSVKAEASGDETYPNTALAASMSVTFQSSSPTVGPDTGTVSIPGVPTVKAVGLSAVSPYIQIDGMPDYGLLPDIGGRVYVANVNNTLSGGGWTYILNPILWTDGVLRPVIYVDANGNFQRSDGTLADALAYQASPIMNYTTKDGRIAYCIQGKLAAPGGITTTMVSASDTLNSQVSRAGRDKAKRILENGYPLNEAYWSAKGFPAEAQRYATQVALWCTLRNEPGNDSSWYDRFLGVSSGNRSNIAVNGQEIDVLGMIRTLVNCAETGRNLYAEPAATVTAKNITVNGGNYVAAFTIASNSNAGYVFQVLDVTGATVQYNGSTIVPAEGGWYKVESGTAAEITVSFPTTNTGSVRLRAIPADTRTYVSLWWAQGSSHTGTEGEHAGGTVQDMVVINTEDYVLNDRPVQTSIPLPTVSATLVKRDMQTGTEAQGDASLEGAVYGVYRASDDSLAATFPATDSNGKATVDGLLPGIEYYAKEITAPFGYRPSSEKYPFQVTDMKGIANNVIPVELNVEDEVLRQPIRLIKMEKNDTEKIPLSDAGFTFYLASDVLSANHLIEFPRNDEGKIDLTDLVMPEPVVSGINGEMELFTGTDGILTTVALPYGEYLAVETTPPATHLAAGPVLIWAADGEKVNPEEPVSVTVYDERFRAVLELIKTDHTGEAIPQANTQFQLYDQDGQLLTLESIDSEGRTIKTDIFQTDSTGKVTVSQPLSCGLYYIQEVKAPVGFAIDTSLIPVNIQKMNVTVYEGEEAYQAVLTTTWNETDDEHFTTAAVRIHDRPITVSICKTDAVEGDGANELTGAVLTVTVKDTIYDNTGEVWKEAGEIVDTWTSEAGTPHIIESLPAGNYILSEKTAPFGYSVAEEAEFSVMDTMKVQNVSMADAPSLGTLSIDKYSQDNGTPVMGTEFTLYYAEDVLDAEGTSVHKSGDVAADIDGNAVLLVTDENGHAEFGGIPIGTYNGDGSFNHSIQYVLKETKQSVGYVPNEEEIPIVFEWNEDCKADIPVHIELTNQPQTGRIGIVKNGQNRIGYETIETRLGVTEQAQYELKPLAGAEFAVYADAECREELFRMVTDEEGMAFSDYIALGTYYIKETATPAGYAIDGKVYKAELIGDATGNVYIRDVMKNIVNLPCSVTLNIYKNGKVLSEGKDSVNEQEIPLAGVYFGIYNAEPVMDYTGEKELLPADTQMAVIRTTEKGIASLSVPLPEGKYYYKELQTPEGFVLDTEKHEFEVAVANEAEKVIDINKETPLINNAVTGTLIIHKADENKEVLEGVEFLLTNVQTKETVTLITDITGTATAENLKAGYMDTKNQWCYYDYILTEVKAKEGYIRDDTKYPLQFIQERPEDSAAAVTLDIVNKKQAPQAPILGVISKRYLGIGLMSIVFVSITVILLKRKLKK